MCVYTERGLDHWPNIYCGVLVFVLLPLYVLQKKIPLREKAPKLFLLGFIFISFSTNTLNFIWHGLNYPDSLPARQSFLYCLLLLTLCFEAYSYIREYTKKELTAVFTGVLFFLLLCEKIVTDDSFTGVCFPVHGRFSADLFCAGLLFQKPWKSCQTSVHLCCTCHHHRIGREHLSNECSHGLKNYVPVQLRLLPDTDGPDCTEGGRRFLPALKSLRAGLRMMRC